MNTETNAGSQTPTIQPDELRHSLAHFEKLHAQEIGLRAGEAVVIVRQLLTSQQRVKDLEAALEECAKTFRRYEQIHLAKGTAGGELKAANNARFAAMCESALHPASPSPADSAQREEGGERK